LFVIIIHKAYNLYVSTRQRGQAFPCSVPSFADVSCFKNWCGSDKKVWYQTAKEIKMHNPDLGLTRLRRLFGKTRQAYYDQSWRNSDEQLHEAFIIDKVKTIRQHIQGIGGLQLHGMLSEELRLHNIQRAV